MTIHVMRKLYPVPLLFHIDNSSDSPAKLSLHTSGPVMADPTVF